MSALLNQMKLDSPWGLWPLDEASGATAFDRSGNGRDATWSSAGHSLITDGPAGMKAAHVGIVKLNGPSYTPGASLTIECWTRVPNTTTDRTVVNWNTVSTISRIVTHIPYSGATTYFDFGNATDGQGRVSMTFSGTVNRWHHFVCTATSSDRNIWMDGAVVLDGAGSTSPSGSGTLVLAGYGASADMENNMDLAMVAVYDTVLSNARIKAHYEAGIRNGSVMG